MHSRFLLSVALAAAISIALAHAARAEIIYSQTTPEEPGSSFASSNIMDRQKTADNFLVNGTEQYTVRSLRVIGGYNGTGTVPNPLPIDDFRITFLNDSAGAPGTPVTGGDFSNWTAVTRTSTDGRLLNGVGAPIEFVFDFGDGITFDRGTEYWISVSNNPTPGTGWAWARAVGVLDQDIASTLNEVDLGPWNASASGGGMWFELSSLNIAEPSSAMLLLMIIPIYVLVLQRR